MRRLIWLVCGLVILSLAGVAFLFIEKSKAETALADKLAQLEAAGIPVSLEEINRQYRERARDTTGNAAPFYERAFAAHVSEGLPMDELIETSRLPGRYQPITPDRLDALAQIVRANREALQLYREAVTHPYLRFDLDFTKGQEMLLPHVRRMRHGAQLLTAESIVAANKGDRERAVEAIEVVFQMAVHLAEEPTLISQLLRVSIEDLGRIGLGKTQESIDLTSPMLANLQATIHSSETAPRMQPAVETELALTEWYFKEIENAAFFTDEDPGPWERLTFFFYRKSGRLAEDHRLFLTRMEDVLRKAKLPHAERLKVDWESDAEITSASGIGEILVGILIPSLGPVLEIDTRSITYLRAAQIALAAERYRMDKGASPSHPEDLVPEYLEELPTDPYSPDGAFRLIREDDVLLVRSSGTVDVPDSGSDTFIEFGIPIQR